MILQELEYQTLINHLIDKQDIIDYADIYKIEGSLVFIDFKKAFDSLEWDCMLLTSVLSLFIISPEKEP
jgi:hypothetical protein